MILIRSQMKHLLHQAKSIRDHRDCCVSTGFERPARLAIVGRKPALWGPSGVFPVLRPK
jgi:hypothetical protein